MNNNQIKEIKKEALHLYYDQAESTTSFVDNWKATVNGFGWRGLNGEKYISADNAKTLLSEVLPDTDCTFHIYNFRNGIAIQNYHHDSPTGNEWYYIVPIASDTYYKFN